MSHAQGKRASDAPYIETTDLEANAARIALVEKFFSFSPNKLSIKNRILVGEGILTKICRRKPKHRHFFLFNDMLLYGIIIVQRKVLRNPQIIEIDDVSVDDIADNGIYRNGFALRSPKKSFTVYAATADEKLQWMAHIKKCVSEQALISGRTQIGEIKKSPVWIPDGEASHCMVCSNVEFTLVNRRHHCRHCGKVVCDKCSSYRWVLPYLGPQKVRICRQCHRALCGESQSGISNVISADSRNRLARPVSMAPTVIVSNSATSVNDITSQRRCSNSDRDSHLSANNNNTREMRQVTALGEPHLPPHSGYRPAPVPPSQATLHNNNNLTLDARAIGRGKDDNDSTDEEELLSQVHIGSRPVRHPGSDGGASRAVTTPGGFQQSTNPKPTFIGQADANDMESSDSDSY